MRRIGGPFDEERQKAGLVIVEAKRLPLQQAAIGTFARAGGRPVKRYSGLVKFFGEGVETAGMRGPADQARRDERSKVRDEIGPEHWRDVRSLLFRIGCDDFQIMAVAEREQRVLSAAAWMHAAKRGANTETLVNEGDTGVDISGAEQNMVENGRHRIAFLRA